jgi:hypothetical protein
MAVLLVLLLRGSSRRRLLLGHQRTSRWRVQM